MRQKYKGDDIKGRLHNTIIRYKEHPYMCNTEGTVIGLHDISSGNLVLQVDSDDENLDISSINIGFVNIYSPDLKLCVYLKREPLRQFKQGIVLELLTQKVLRAGSGGLSKSALMCRGFVDAVLGRFPTYNEALKMITKDSWHSVALSRDIAIKRENELLKVYIKDTEVGYIRLSETNKLIVPKNAQSYYHVLLLEDIRGWSVVEGNK
ncbi:hypothetical protein EVB99_037 [Rhizobium phage RHph_N3_19]|nr:hypothetical protein EVB99_037 [Rhizobium phage RHph_N3_19]